MYAAPKSTKMDVSKWWAANLIPQYIFGEEIFRNEQRLRGQFYGAPNTFIYQLATSSMWSVFHGVLLTLDAL